MSRRRILRAQIQTAWHEAIQNDYCTQRINSERSLQASLWSKLNTILPPATRRMFIEPAMRIKVNGGRERQARFPDIVICNTKEVVGIIEIKFQPRSLPGWKKDLATFDWIVLHSEQIVISNSRFVGIAADEREYPLSNDVLYVWAGVHRVWSSWLSQHVDPDRRPMFLELHAETSSNKAPQIRYQ